MSAQTFVWSDSQVGLLFSGDPKQMALEHSHVTLEAAVVVIVHGLARVQKNSLL